VSNPGGVAEELNMKAGGDVKENVSNPGRVAEELNMKAGRDVEEKVLFPGGVVEELNARQAETWRRRHSTQAEWLRQCPEKN